MGTWVSRRNMAWLRQFCALAGLSFVIISCSYRGAELDNPVVRSLSWFSYAGGDDLRDGCAPPASDRIRVIYNGMWDGYKFAAPSQVRTYDIVALPGGQGAVMTTRIFGESNTLTLSLSDPFQDLRGIKAETTLSAAEYASLKRALIESGLLEPPPYGLRLPSNRYWWLAVGCIDGHFHQNGWAYPSERFSRIRFADPVLRLDKTGVPLSPPQEPERFPPVRSASGPFGGVPDRAPSFILQIGSDRPRN
jgi:hypothetical protein